MPYSMLLMLPRRPDLTPEQFREHYENGHASLINSLCEDPKLRPNFVQANVLCCRAYGSLWYGHITTAEHTYSSHVQGSS